MSKSGQWKNNVKQVIRVTLVGIDPSDQVQIKGYLRILLRVDFDIEWVPPKNPKVDLFIVNHAFSNSDSVKALINQFHSPVLYVARNSTKSNTIENNTLYLKLEHVAILEAWLKQNVPRIYETFNAENLARNENQHTPNASELDAQSGNYTPPSFSSNQLSENAVQMINCLNGTHTEKYFEVISDGTSVAIIKPKERLIWPKGDTFFPNLSLGWQIKEIATPSLQIKHAMNLNTWVWICALHQDSHISKILPLDAKLSLKTWPKPKNNADKSDYLRILAMTELKPLSVNDIAKKTNISIDKIHRCMAALYMAGFMDTGLLTLDVYVKQQVRQLAPAKNSNLQNGALVSDSIEVQTKDGQFITSKDELEKVIDNQIETKLNSSYLGKKPAPASKDKGFPGLLSRIRSTLGF